jgi:PhnB protein
MTQINAYITFNGNCREAMTFYRGCLGGELTIQTIGESPMGARCPAGKENEILHSSLVKDHLVLMASDMIGDIDFVNVSNIALSLNCSSEEEINSFYSSLSAGGTIIDPLKLQFWGALFAVFTDKFGIRWMLNYDKNLTERN